MNKEQRDGGFTDDPREAARRRFLQTGFGYFTDISNAYPGSVPAQSVALALLCQASMHDPHALMESLRRDPGYVERIRVAAEARHKAAGVEEVAGVITTERIDHVLQAVGLNAQRMMFMRSEDLTPLLAHYPESMKNDDTKATYRRFVLMTVGLKERERGRRRS